MDVSWTIKKAELQRLDAFELWCWRRLLRVPRTTGRSNQSVLKEINPEYTLEGLLLKLKLQYFGNLMWRADSLEKTLMLVKTDDRRRRGWQRMRWLDGIIVSVDISLSKLREMVKDREVWCAVVHGITKSRTWLSSWTTTIATPFSVSNKAGLTNTSYSVMSDSFATPWTIALQDLLMFDSVSICWPGEVFTFFHFWITFS